MMAKSLSTLFRKTIAKAESGDRQALTQLPIISQRMLDDSTSYAGQRSCAELGVCQHLPVPCLICKASPWPEAKDTLTPMEQIATYVGYSLLAMVSVAVVAGCTSYTYYRWFAQ